jgi:hypothetical protein
LRLLSASLRKKSKNKQKRISWTDSLCKTPQMYAEYLGRIGQDVLPKREGLIEWKCKQPKQKGPR